MSDLFKGFGYLGQGFQLILHPKFRMFLLVPIAINIILFGALITLAVSMFSGWLEVLMSWLPSWLSFLEWLFWLIYFLALMMAMFYSFVTGANLIGAPFYGYLAEKVEEHLDGKIEQEDFDWKALVKLIPRTVGREIQKILYFLPRVIGLVILGFIPGLNALAALLWIIFSAWMMTVQCIDYPADNNGLSFREMRKYLSKHRFAAFGFGWLASILVLFPIVNLVILPAAVCGAVVFWVEQRMRFRWQQDKGMNTIGEQNNKLEEPNKKLENPH